MAFICVIVLVVLVSIPEGYAMPKKGRGQTKNSHVEFNGLEPHLEGSSVVFPASMELSVSVEGQPPIKMSGKKVESQRSENSAVYLNDNGDAFMVSSSMNSDGSVKSSVIGSANFNCRHLGAYHDGDGNTCDPSLQNIMSSSLGNSNEAIYSTFWNDAGRDCLGSINRDTFLAQFCGGPRGEVYDLDQQCQYQNRLTSGSSTACDGFTIIGGVKVVDEIACAQTSNVSCSLDGGSTCETKLYHVFDGTPCLDADHVCYNGQCLMTTVVCSSYNGTINSPLASTLPPPSCTCRSNRCCRSIAAPACNCDGCVVNPRGNKCIFG
ncbi:hypothetical protein MAR_037616 [Mya arenaria]|uniref:ADAMTS cysteine-rich domain-containing protein n=1 Tax=Mya arenaria TaxID=6604 RepID=A0ABY7FP86_MYAAR|nr:hypothetical protein MAR_037616 [Mya arenaria]